MNIQKSEDAKCAAQMRVLFIGDSHAFPDVLMRLVRIEFEGVDVARLSDIEANGAPAEGPALAIFDERFIDRVENDYAGLCARLPEGATPVLAYRTIEAARRLFAAQHQDGRLKGLRFLPADASVESWALMMRLLLKGEPVTPCELTEPLRTGDAAADAALAPCARLTRREVEVLDLMAAGNGNKHIAAELGLSYHTVKLHIHNVFNKIGVRNRAAATNWYLTRRAPNAAAADASA